MGAFYDVVTPHRSTLAVERATGRVRNAEAEARGAACDRLVGFAPQTQPGICLLVAHDLPVPGLTIGNQQFRGVLPLRAIGPDPAGVVSFYDPATGGYLCAGPPDPDSGIGSISLEPRRIGADERFTLRELPAFYVTAEVDALCACCEDWLDSGANPDALIERLLRTDPGPDWAPVIEVMARLMPLAQLAIVAEWLMDAPEGLRRLARFYPDDFDATVVLPRLRESLHPSVREPAAPADGVKPSPGDRGRRAEARARAPRRFWRLLVPDPPGSPVSPGAAPAPGDAVPPQGLGEPAPEEAVGPERDFLASRGAQGQDVSFPHVCAALVRQSVHPGQDACIVTAAANESLYLLEWLAYHRLIGVQKFFVYAGAGFDGSDALLAALHRGGVLTAIRAEAGAGVDRQAKAHGHVFGVLPDILDYRWAMAIGVDEFFAFDPAMFGSIRDYIAWQESQAVDAVGLNWVAMCSGGQVRWRDQPVTRRFRTQIGGPGALVKSLCRPHRFVHATPHFPVALRQRPFIFRNSDRDIHTWAQTADPALSDRPVADSAWINAYFFKSAEEFAWRGAGADDHGDAALTPESVTLFMAQHAASSALAPAREAEAISRAAPDLGSEIGRLMALPGVAAAMDQVKAAYRERSAAVAEMAAALPAMAGAGEAGRRFLDLFQPVAAPEPALPRA